MIPITYVSDSNCHELVFKELGVMSNTYNPCNHETELEILGIESQPKLRSRLA